MSPHKIKDLRNPSGAVFSKVQRFSQNPPVLIFRRHGLSKAVMEKNRGAMAARCTRGLNPVESLRTRQLNQVIHGAADAAQIDKRVSMHTLRHYSESRTNAETSRARSRKQTKVNVSSVDGRSLLGMILIFEP